MSQYYLSFSLLCIGGSSFVSTGSVLPGVRVPHNALPPSHELMLSGSCPEATCMCRETLASWLFTSPFSLSWAPIACSRRRVMNCWGTASRKVPVESQWPKKPSEHQLWPGRNCKPDRGTSTKKSQVPLCSHEPCPPLITHQFRSSEYSASSGEAGPLYDTSTQACHWAFVITGITASVLDWGPLQSLESKTVHVFFNPLVPGFSSAYPAIRTYNL